MERAASSIHQATRRRWPPTSCSCSPTGTADAAASSGGAAAGAVDFSRVADDLEDVYQRLVARRHDRRPHKLAAARVVAGRPLIDVDLHMHTDHSYDCATPVEVLLAEARGKGLGAIAVTEHNEISGALEAAEKAKGIKVIVGEEVKTASQGEVIGLFIKEKIPRGMTLQETIAEIKRQGGLVYVPHPFDRMHSVPDYRHLLDVLDDIDLIEVFNPRVAISEFNEEAVRFAAKYRMIAGAGSDAHVPQGLGSVRIRMHDFDGPEQFLESLRTPISSATRPACSTYRRLSSCKPRHCRRAGARPRGSGGCAARRASPDAEGASPDAHARTSGRGVQFGRGARNRRRDPREVPRAGDTRVEPSRPRHAGL